MLSAIKKSNHRETVTFYLLISPWLIGLVCFVLGPIVASFVISFMRWDMISPAKLIGLENYRHMFTEDPLFWKSLGNTLFFTFVRVPLALVVALGLALLMNQGVRGIGVFRSIFYLPSVVSGVAVSMLWVWVFNPNFGIMNAALEAIGIRGPGWFTDPNLALSTLVLVSLYNVGGTAVIFLAGLKNIPVSLYEASDLDGASAWQKFIYITIPQLTPTILFNLIMLLITSFQTFTEPLIITNGGPVNSTLLFNLYLYQNAFSYSKLGYACAMAWIMFVITMACSAYVFKTSKRWVYYEGGDR